MILIKNKKNSEREKKKNILRIIDYYTDYFWRTIKTVNIINPDIFCKATNTKNYLKALILLIFIVFFLRLSIIKKASAVENFTLPAFLEQTGINQIYLPPCSWEERQSDGCQMPDPMNLEMLKHDEGIFTFRWQENIVGDSERSGEDRYEITFNENIKNIYGLGVIPGSAGVAVDDFLDSYFSVGHATNPKGEIVNSDQTGGRTPIFVIPSKNLIIAYIQNEVKVVRLSRLPNETTIILKKKDNYGQFGTGTLVVIKGDSLKNAYSKYYSYLKTQNYFFKKPHYKAFGINWEVYGEMGVYPSIKRIEEALAYYLVSGLKIETVTVGSGYWSYEYGLNSKSPNYKTDRTCTSTDAPDFNDCGSPSMEIMFLNDNFKLTIAEAIQFGVSDENNDGQYDLRDYFVKLNKKGIYPILGMRHNSRTEYANEFKNKLLSVNPNLNPSAIYIDADDIPYYGDPGFGNIITILNTSDNEVMSAFIDLLKLAYGDFKGIKEDEMHIVDQDLAKNNLVTLGVPQDKLPLSGKNIPDLHFSKVFSHYNRALNNDLVVMGSNNYFGFGSDVAAVNNWVPFYSQNDIWETLEKDLYKTKFSIDRMLTNSISGYPHSALLKNYHFITDDNQYSSGGDKEGGVCTIIDIRNDDVNKVHKEAKMYLRDWQFATFTPVVWQACGFWHLDEDADYFPSRDMNLMTEYKNSFVFFSNLRMRLHQYAYDQAQEWYYTGIPTLMQPLFVNEEWKNDPYIHEMYKTCLPENDCYPSINANTFVQDEYMFGNALLIRPIMTDKDDSLRVYLPKGNWVSFLKPEPIINSDGMYYDFIPTKINHYPVFLKEGQILIIGKYDNPEELQAYIFLDKQGSSEIYRMYDRSHNLSNNNYIQLQAEKIGETVYLKNIDNGQKVVMKEDSFGKGYYVADLAPVLSLFQCFGEETDNIINNDDVVSWGLSYNGNIGSLDIYGDNKTNAFEFGHLFLHWGEECN